MEWILFVWFIGLIRLKTVGNLTTWEASSASLEDRDISESTPLVSVTHTKITYKY